MPTEFHSGSPNAEAYYVVIPSINVTGITKGALLEPIRVDLKITEPKETPVKLLRAASRDAFGKGDAQFEAAQPAQLRNPKFRNWKIEIRNKEKGMCIGRGSKRRGRM